MALQTKDPSTAVISSVGTAVSGGTTSSNRPVITGTADAGNIVVIYDGIRPIGSVTVAANGTWSFTPAADLKAGAHSFAAIAHDTANNFGASSALVNVTITSSAVTPSTPIITDDHGLPIVAGGTTADAKPQISGSGPAGDIITVYDGATPIGSTKINPDGKWTFTPTTDLSNATHAITVTDKVPGGTEGPHSGAAGFTVDTTVPATPSITSATNWNGDDRIGGVPVGAVVASPDVVILGKALAGAVVYVYDGATLMGSSVAQLNGSWSFENRAFAQGSHDITATVKNAAGTESAHSNHWTFSVDSSTPAKPTAPTVTDDNGATIVPGGITNDALPHIDGKGTPGDTITVLDNDKVIGSTTVKPDGNWSFTPTTGLNDGPHDITVIDKNPAGTSSPASDPTHITIDTSVPAKPATPVLTDASDAVIPAGSTTNDGHPHISGTGKAGDTITVYDGTKAIGVTTVQPDGKWTFTPATDLSTGAHSISVIETNAAGTPSPKSDAVPFTYSVVSGAPVIESVVDAVGTITGPIVNGGVTDDSHPTISGTGVVGYTVYIFQNGTGCGDATVDATGHWTVTLKGALSDGPHVMTATQFTGSGAQSVASNAWTITVDTSTPAKPPVPILTDESNALIPAGSTTADGHPHISGTGKAGDTITVYDGSNVIGSTKIGSDGKWTFTPSSDVSQGTHNISVTDTNPAGTTGPKSDAIAFTFSLVAGAPVIVNVADANSAHTGTVPAGGTTTDTNPTVSGTGTPGGTVTLYQNGAGCGDTTVGSDGKWSIKISGALSIGVHDFTATQHASGLSESAASNHWSITINSPISVPATPATPVLTDDNNALIPAGSTTNDGHPHISGNGTAGDIIKVYDNGSIIGSTTIGSDGKWTYTPPSNMSTGGHSISVTESNSAGTSGQSGSIGFNYSLVAGAPVIVNVADANSAHTGTVPAGGTTTDTNPTVSGTGIPGGTVTLYQNGAGCGDTTVGSDGKWSIKLIGALSIGAHDFTATQHASGLSESAASNHWSITIGTSVPAAPAITGVSYGEESWTWAFNMSSGDTVQYSYERIGGTGPANSVVYLYDGATLIGSTGVGATGIWSTGILNFSNGTHDLSATVKSGGVESAHSNHWTFTVGTASVPATPATPVLTDESNAVIPAGSTTADAHPHISGTGTAGDIIKVYDNGSIIGSTTIGSDGKWTYTPPSDMSSGAHSITVTESNAAGTSPTSGAAPFTIGAAVPAAITITGVYDHNHALIPDHGSNTGTFTVEGTATGYANGDTVSLTFAGATALGDPFVVRPQIYNVQVVNGKFSVVITADTKSGLDGQGLRIFSGNAGDIAITALLQDSAYSNKAGSSAYTITETSWTSSVPVTPATPGVPTLTDDAGMAIWAGTTTTDGHPNINGRGTAGDIIKVYDNGSIIGSTTIAANGQWSFKPSSDLATGAHSISVTESNSAGTSAQSGSIAFNFVAGTAPAAPIISATIGGDAAWTSTLSMQSGDTTSYTHEKIAGSGVAGTVVYVYDGATLIASTTVTQSGTWNTNVLTFSNGTHDISATTVSGGVESAHSNHWAFTVNTVPVTAGAPVITNVADANSAHTGTVPAGGTTTDTNPTVSGTGVPGDTVILYQNGSGCGQTTVASNGTWSIKISGALSTGSHDFTATQYASGQSESTASNHWSVTVNSANTGAGQVWALNTDLNGNTTNGGRPLCSYYVNVGNLVDQGYQLRCLISGNGQPDNNLFYFADGSGVLKQTAPGIFGWWSNHSLSGSDPVTITWMISKPGQTGWTTIDSHTTAFWAANSVVHIPVNGTMPVSAVQSVYHGNVAGDETVLAQAQDSASSDSETSVQSHTTEVGEHDAFKGTTGHDTVDLNADPASYFKESTAHIEGSTAHPTDSSTGLPAVNTLHLTGDHQVLDLTSLTGQTAAAKISGIEVIDLGGQHNTLKLSLVDVLNLGEADLFQKDGKQQMMVNGKEGDEVDLSNSHIAGLAEGEWQAHGTTEVGGVTYNVYEHSGVHTELLVQQGVQIVVH